jgi:ectoine hydroxylase-related dioxygenase (phytanoyl-CoA dioxygenase family)
MVDTSAAVLGGPVYHYQSKLTAKEPAVGGAWEWHQDYGYWYYNGCLRPDLLSVMIALDKTTRENGCLQIATGSHRLGRIDHTPLSPTQNEVDPKRMPHILEQCPIEYCELDKGDALIFHCNAIHRSDANRSANRRWTLLICYNRVDNDTIIKTDDRYFVPLEAVDDEALRRAGLRFASADNQEHFASRPYVPDLRKAS